MATVPYTNPKKHTVHINGKAIAPGDTRDVEETMIPGYRPPPKAQAEETADPVAELYGQTVADIIAQLPDLPDEDLKRLAQIEGGKDKPRVSLIKALSEESIRRADASLKG